ncbi:MAG: hypothetical protein J6M90_08665 [Oscillospiraceae bacterium]|nr:hypothetical protein [Oscillospiraceae bacterium]
MKRFISIIVSCIISSLMCFSAYAFGFEDEAYDYTSGKVLRSTVINYDNPHYYKLNVTSDGQINISLTMESSSYVKLLDENGSKIMEWKDYKSSSTGLSNISAKQNVTKGVYYVGIWNNESDSFIGPDTRGTGEYKFSATFPSNSTDKTATGAYPAIYLSSGDSIGLGAVVSNTVRDDVTISTSNRRVAKVNSYGYVTAVKKGTAVITIKYGRTSTKLCVVVE